jgi:hypothetical protein
MVVPLSQLSWKILWIRPGSLYPSYSHPIIPVPSKCKPLPITSPNYFKRAVDCCRSRNPTDCCARCCSRRVQLSHSLLYSATVPPSSTFLPKKIIIHYQLLQIFPRFLWKRKLSPHLPASGARRIQSTPPLLRLHITYSMQQSPSWETKRFSASQISPYFMEPENSLPHSPVPATRP